MRELQWSLSVEVAFEGTTVMCPQAGLNAFASRSSALIPNDRVAVSLTFPPALGVWLNFFSH